MKTTDERQIVESLLKAYDHAISAGELEECARQFMAWTHRVASALNAAKMTDAYNVWKPAQDALYFFSEDSSFPAQAESMRAILLGILKECERGDYFISDQRIEELRGLTTSNYDLTKLVRLCDEINLSYANDCFFATAALTRTVLDHVPPVFGFDKFSEVASHYRGGSFKKGMQHLDQSLRQIANRYLHSKIRNSESLPNRMQVNFSSDLDVMLEEIVRILTSAEAKKPAQHNTERASVK